jgi:hypothetical protein
MKTIEFLKNLLGNGRGAAVLSLFTPVGAQERSIGTRLIMAGGTMTVLGMALATAVAATALMMVAVGVIYYLMTQVLGIRLDIDPRSLVQQAQRYANASAPN